MMAFDWMWWLLWSALAVGAVFWVRQRGEGVPRWWRGLVWAGAGLVLLYPLGWWLGLAFIEWLYEAPSAALDRLMASRHTLPATFYQAKGMALLGWAERLAMLPALATLAWALLKPFLGTKPRERLKVLGAAVLLLSAAFTGYNLWLNAQFRQPHPVFYTDCHKVWAHRRNAIPLATAAFDAGAAGIEMDIRYDTERREFFIGRYDEPPPPPGQRLLLADVFAHVANRGYFWLDTKTLHYLTPEQAQQAAADMRALLDQFGLRQRAIIESDRPQNLQYFARAGLHTSYWIFNIDESAFPKTPWGQWWALARIKRNYIRYGFSAISMDHRFYTPMVQWMLRGARIHLFTVDDKATLEALVQRPEVKVVLTNTDDYDLTACP